MKNVKNWKKQSRKQRQTPSAKQENKQIKIGLTRAREPAIQTIKTRGAKNANKLARTRESRLLRKKARLLDEEALIKIERDRSIQDFRKFYKHLNDVRQSFEPQVAMCQDKNGELLTNKNQALERWKEQFKEHLNEGSKILYDRLLPYANAAVQHYQAGFQSGKSTTDQLIALHQILEKCNEFNITTHHLFIDFKAAYDIIIRNEVYVGMSELNFPTKLICLTKATPTILTCCVKIQNDCSKSFENRQGLRQGYLLSSLSLMSCRKLSYDEQTYKQPAQSTTKKHNYSHMPMI
jgi:hypothetical protein